MGGERSLSMDGYVESVFFGPFTRWAAPEHKTFGFGSCHVCPALFG